MKTVLPASISPCVATHCISKRRVARSAVVQGNGAGRAAPPHSRGAPERRSRTRPRSLASCNRSRRLAPRWRAPAGPARGRTRSGQGRTWAAPRGSAGHDTGCLRPPAYRQHAEPQEQGARPHAQPPAHPSVASSILCEKIWSQSFSWSQSSSWVDPRTQVAGRRLELRQ